MAPFHTLGLKGLGWDDLGVVQPLSAEPRRSRWVVLRPLVISELWGFQGMI
jgi:hypothetical protein